MSKVNIENLLACAVESASAGAKELRARVGTALNIQSKTSPEDMVTDADLAAEEVVREVITRLRPNDAISGEELAETSTVKSQIRWSIDPLDGTVNFTRGIPFFATSVAALDLATGKWLAGAVVAPMLDVSYFAGKGLGATKLSATGSTKLSGPTTSRATKIVATGFSYSAQAREQQFRDLAQVMQSFVDVRRMGSAALDICLVADGTFDAFYESHLKEHDWAAAMLIAEEAGLSVQRPKFDGDRAAVNMP